MPEQVERGRVHIANAVLADLAGYAALECYGVVGMTSPTVKDGVAQLLSREKLRKGVLISNEGDAVKVDLYVVIEHGTKLTEVAHSLAERVEYVLTSQADVKVASVDVHVQDVKVRN
jgi:uncharacterized alkaline shock family protein YloU